MGLHDEAALLDQIRAAPDDDAPRLVFADALSDRGDPWGELIVAGCELARLERERVIDAARRRGLEERSRTIRQQRWRARGLRIDAAVERGFCTAITSARDTLREVEGYEFAMLREVTLWVNELGLATLAGWPLLRQIERLVLRGLQHSHVFLPYSLAPEAADARAAALDRIAERARPWSLEFNNVEMHKDEMLRLVRSPLRASLRRLALIRWPGLGAVNLDRLALDTLVMNDLALTGEDASRALGSPAFDSVKALDLSDNPLGETGMRAIVARPLPGLRALRVLHTYMGPQALMLLARASFVPRLTALAIGEEHANPTVRPLCQLAEAAGQLTDLAIDQRWLSADDAAEIVRRLRSPLQALRLRIGDRGLPMVTELLRNPALRGLRKLDLSGQAIGHAAVVALARAELPALESLDLSSCQLEPESAFALANSTTLPHSLALRLRDNASGPDRVTDALLARFHDVRH